MDDDEGEQPDMVISAEPDDNGVLTQMNNIHYEQPDDVAGSQFICSQICSPDEGNVHSNTEAVHDHSNLRSETDNVQSNVRTIAVNDESNNAVSASDSEEDTEYIAHSEDSGENSEVVELRRHARKFKKRMRDTKSWIAGDSTAAIPIDLIANMEDQLEGEEKQWGYDSSDEDYSYDEYSNGAHGEEEEPVSKIQ
ncbi:hypothetical protein ZWY2020_044992 [Hordeum vulgare]|nr:hypothetical protein ZWY2020_044992 [Hordeum vulgare]